MRHFEASAGGNAPHEGERALARDPQQPPAVGDVIDLTLDQADRLRFATQQFFVACEELGLRSLVLMHKLTDTAAFDAYPAGALSEVGRQRTWDWAFSDNQTMHVHLRHASSEREA
jgi:hypothetical protein